MSSDDRAAALGAATLCGAFQITASAFAERPALRMHGSDREWTWRQYAEAVRRLAALLLFSRPTT